MNKFEKNKSTNDTKRIKKLFFGFVVIILGIILFIFGFIYAGAAQCGYTTLCGLNRDFYNIVFFIPISILLIVLGFTHVHKNIKK